jgi:chromosome segregation ATPase
MPDAPITLSPQVAVSIAVGVLALRGAVTGGVFKVMKTQVSQWKELHKAKEDELHQIQENPKAVARDYIAGYRTVMEQQIAETEKKLATLKEELAKRDQIIATMTEQTKESEQKLLFHAGVKEELEKTIAAYEEFVVGFNRDLSFTSQVISALDQNEFDAAKVKQQLEQLEKRIDHIKAKSLRKFRDSVKADVNRAAVQKAAKVQAALKEKKEAEQTVKARMAASLPLPGSDDRSKSSRNR